MPELVNISVGSLPGTSGLESTTVCPLLAKKSRKVLRMSATEMVGAVMDGPGRGFAATGSKAPRARRCSQQLNI